MGSKRGMSAIFLLSLGSGSFFLGRTIPSRVGMVMTRCPVANERCATDWSVWTSAGRTNCNKRPLTNTRTYVGWTSISTKQVFTCLFNIISDNSLFICSMHNIFVIRYLAIWMVRTMQSSSSCRVNAICHLLLFNIRPSRPIGSDTSAFSTSVSCLSSPCDCKSKIER